MGVRFPASTKDHARDAIPKGPPQLILMVTAGVLCALWLAFLLLQTGHPWDESEHAHVAWLMSQGERPLLDFFQHHQPLLWDLLSIYYRLGFQGAGVLVWGRILVVLCALLCIWSLLGIGNSSDARRVALAGVVGIAALVGITMYLQALFVSRPETLSIAFMMAALLLWSRPDLKGMGPLFAAGVLAGAACYASPRFLLLAGAFLVLGTHTIRRWVLLIAGGVLFVLAYTLISDFPLTHVFFNLQFSAKLQTIGDYGAGPTTGFWALFAVATVVPMLPLLTGLQSGDRLRGLLLVANLLFIFAVSHQLAGEYRYQQAYAPFAAGVPLTVVWLLARFRPSPGKALGPATGAIALTMFSVCLLQVSQPRLEFTLLQEVRDRNALAAIVPPGRTVLLFSRKHPIAVADVSYYGSPLFDARDRLCRAVREFPNAGLPACDLKRDIQEGKPYLLDTWIERTTSLSEAPALREWIRERYIPASLPHIMIPLLRDGVMVESEHAAGA